MTNISDLSNPSHSKKSPSSPTKVNFLFNQTSGQCEGASVKRFGFVQLTLFSFTEEKLSKTQVECNSSLLEFIASDQSSHPLSHLLLITVSGMGG